MTNKSKIYLLAILTSAMLAYTCTSSKHTVKRDENGNIIVKTDPNFEYLTKKEGLASIYLPKGYKAQLVASEPMVIEPVAIAWDGNGVMYVAELRTYMQDIFGNDQDIPVSTIKRLEDTNGDGVMDKYTIFIDSLVLPRMIMPLDDRLLVSETYTHHIYSFKDTDGDGIADEKEMVFKDDSVSKANLEHQRSGLVWNLDNKIYVSVESRRYNYQNGKLIPEGYRERPGGQWGLANDNYGRIFLSSAGAETPALNFQQNPFYGRLDLRDQYTAEFKSVWPIVSTPDVQGGVKRLRPDSTLNHFTGGGGQTIYRGDKMPDLAGDLFIAEPVGRLVRRAKVHQNNGKVTLTNAYNKEEFLVSTDMNFRPVNTATGPDGYLYIVDMHRGIIQESAWTKPGSYLGEQILRNKLDKNIGRGRIYRIVPDDKKPARVKPQLLSKTPAELVNYLNHPNGWFRDNAQKLMVLKKDQSVSADLKKLTKSENHLSRIHSLWTLNGLNALDKNTLIAALQDKDERVRKTAVWISDEYMDKNPEIISELEKLKNDPSADVRYQLALTLRFKETDKAQEIISYLLKTYPDHEVLIESEIKYQSVLAAKRESERKAKEMKQSERELVSQGATIYNSLCATCHGSDGKGIAIGGKDLPAPALAGSKNVLGDPEKLIKILLHGLKGPIDGKEYPDIMPGFGFNDDNYIASALSFIRNDLGNKASIVTPTQVAKVRKENAGRTDFWTMEELNKR
jgi:glucose/arabinose dehydrogenase/mono/diheme cytochrome c family protein